MLNRRIVRASGGVTAMQDISDYHRYCPNQPHIIISDAVCLSRRRANYPWCKGCPFNDDEKQQRDAPPPPPRGAAPEAEPPPAPPPPPPPSPSHGKRQPIVRKRDGS
jgi:hypothetical protein